MGAGSRRAARVLRVGVVAALAALAALLACAAPLPPELEDRLKRAERERSDDPAVQARVAQVEAALERERALTPIEDMEIRVGDRWDGDHRVRLLSRIPLPDPRRLSSQRAERRADTEAAIARLEQTVLDRSADDCARGTLAGLYDERMTLYQSYVERQTALLERSEEGRRSGARNEWSALRFSIERKVRLAETVPAPPRTGIAGPEELPQVGVPDAPLRTDSELVSELVVRQHPAVAMRDALARRYDALSERAASERRPWFDFVDIGYAFNEADHDAVSGQLAIRVPLGAASSAGVGRYKALRHGQARDAQRVALEQTRIGLQALDELRRFESDTPRWNELLELARQAEDAAERWWQSGIASPEQVADLLDEAFDARSTVLEARTQAGLASCRLLSATGVEAVDWPRASYTPGATPDRGPDGIRLPPAAPRVAPVSTGVSAPDSSQ